MSRSLRIDVQPMPELAERAARQLARGLHDACRRRGRCSLALSGGSTPGPMFRHLASLEVPWDDVDVFQVDERAAPRGHTDRNLTLIERELGRCFVRLHEMPVEAENLDTAAASYGAELEDACGRPPVIDVVHLGLGRDGHTASLVPGDPALELRDRWVGVTEPYEGYRRLTLTLPVLDRAGLVVLLVTEAEKAPALAGVLAEDENLPAARVKAQDVSIFAVPDAASGISAPG